jgi:hypothetical protein
MKKRDGKTCAIILLLTLLCSSVFLGITGRCDEAETPEITLTSTQKPIQKGEQFTLTILLDPKNIEIGGWEFNVVYTQGIVSAQTVTSGDSWTEFFEEGIIDNSNGVISNIETWSKGPYPTEMHTICTITFEAEKSGECILLLDKVQLRDSLFNPVNVTVNSITITVLDDDQDSQGGGGSNSGNQGDSSDSDNEDNQSPDDTDNESAYDTNETSSSNEDNQNATENPEDGGQDQNDQNDDGANEEYAAHGTQISGSLQVESSILLLIAAVIIIVILLFYVKSKHKK